MFFEKKLEIKVIKSCKIKLNKIIKFSFNSSCMMTKDVGTRIELILKL